MPTAKRAFIDGGSTPKKKATPKPKATTKQRPIYGKEMPTVPVPAIRPPNRGKPAPRNEPKPAVLNAKPQNVLGRQRELEEVKKKPTQADIDRQNRTKKYTKGKKGKTA